MSITSSHVIRATAAHYGITTSELIGKIGKHYIAHPRQVGYRVMRDVTNRSLAQIGRAFGGRDHNTIIKGLMAIDKRADPEEADAIFAIKKAVERMGEPAKPHLIVGFLPISTRQITIRNPRIDAHK